jgi:DNA-binding transcriptional MerR regulator
MNAHSIAEVSSLTNLSAHTLRYYERLGLVSSVHRDPGGRRVYDDADLGWIRFLQMLRSTGMSLEHIAEFVHLEKQGTQTLPARRELLHEQRSKLEAHIAQLQATLGALNDKIAYYDSANPQTCPCFGGSRLEEMPENSRVRTARAV